MLGVCFRTEKVGWMQDQWSWVFSNFGITDIWERGYGTNTDEEIYQTIVGIDTAAELPTEPKLVVLSPPDAKFIQGSEPLHTFVHPENVIYLFGGSYSNLTDEDDLGGRIPDHTVCIPTVKLECYSQAAAYMTLWDRFVKRGDFG